MKIFQPFFQFLLIIAFLLEIMLFPKVLDWKVHHFSINISGEISHADSGLTGIFQYDPITWQKKFIAIDEEDSAGHFNFSFDALEPQFYYLLTEDEHIECYLSPGDYLSFVKHDSLITWFGEGELINQFLVDFHAIFDKEQLSIFEITLTNTDSLINYFVYWRNQQMDFLKEKEKEYFFPESFSMKYANLILSRWYANLLKVQKISKLRMQRKDWSKHTQVLDSIVIDSLWPLEHPDQIEFLYHYTNYHSHHHKIIRKYERISPARLIKSRTRALQFHNFIDTAIHPGSYEIIWGRYLFYTKGTRYQFHDSVYSQFANRHNNNQ